MTHKQELLAWFRRGLTITPAEAVDRWNNYRLADTIYRLRKDGHLIHTETMERINDNGYRITWARYSYISGPRGGTVAPRPMPAPQDCPPCQQDAEETIGDVLSELWRKIRGNFR